MEDPIYNPHELQEFDDNLSFRDLPIHDPEETELNNGHRNSVSDQDFSFEFSTTAHSHPEMYTQFGDIMFPPRFAKHINGSFHNDREINSLFTMNSPRMFSSKNNATNSHRSLEFSNSVSRSSSSGLAMGSGRRVPGKKHGVLIGLARVPARMELGEIKKRQSKRPPPPMFPVAEVGSDGAGRGHSGLLGPLRYRSLLLTVLAKASHGCIPRV